MATQKAHPIVTIQDRLENGNLTIDEVCALANRSRTGFYSDLKAGLSLSAKLAGKASFRGRSPKPTSLAKRLQRDPWPKRETRPRWARAPGSGISFAVPQSIPEFVPEPAPTLKLISVRSTAPLWRHFRRSSRACFPAGKSPLANIRSATPRARIVMPDPSGSICGPAGGRISPRPIAEAIPSLSSPISAPSRKSRRRGVWCGCLASLFRGACDDRGNFNRHTE